MNCAKQNQRERERDVHQQPAVQPTMQPLLAGQLARFIANVFKVVERGMCCCGQQSAQSGNGTAYRCCISKTLASPSRSFKKGPHFVEIKATKRRTFLLAQADDFRSGSDSRASSCTHGRG